MQPGRPTDISKLGRCAEKVCTRENVPSNARITLLALLDFILPLIAHMQAALPLARSVSHALGNPLSRIPHLEYHIVRKLQRPRKTNRSTCAHSQQLRRRSSTTDASLSSLWPASTYDGPITSEVEALPPAAEQTLTPRPSSASRAIDFNSNQVPDQASSRSLGFVDLSSASHHVSASPLLDEGCPERLMTWLISHPMGHAFIVSATVEDFDRAFCALDPRVLADPFVRAQRHLGRAADADLELSFRRSLVDRLRSFAAHIDEIMVRRREFGAALSLSSCRHALRCAASVGDVRVADHIWDDVMAPASVEPDIACYNAYLEAHMWNLAYSEIARKSFRNTKRTLELRSRIQRPRNLLGYRVSTRQPEPDWALRARALAIFQDITNKGLVTDEETFVNLMIGLARSADVPGVSSILKSVWNIDVDALDSYDEEELESPTYYPDSHPLRPTAKLLFAVVHSYAINNRVDKAWNLLDYISRNYALSIPLHVWDELFEWTYVLSLPRAKVQRDQGQSEGRIHMRQVEHLFNTLTDEPHNVKPSPIITNLLARTYRKRHMLEKCLDTVRTTEKNMVQQLEELRLMVDTIKAMLENPRGIIDNGMLSQKFVKFRNDFQLTFLSVRQQYAFMITETRQILKEDHFAVSGNQDAWSTLRLPQIIEEFEQYLPNFCDYRTTSGYVSIELAEHRDAAQDAGWIRPLLLEATAMWEALDTVDLFQMAGDLHELSAKLKELQAYTRSQPKHEV